MAAQERDRIPYPIDEGLIREAQMIGSGAWVHDINRAIANYRYGIKRWQETYECHRWYAVVKSERELRGIVAEARMGKHFHAPWATRKDGE